jgi:hypothetical protein
VDGQNYPSGMRWIILTAFLIKGTYAVGKNTVDIPKIKVLCGKIWRILRSEGQWRLLNVCVNNPLIRLLATIKTTIIYNKNIG